MYEVPSTKYQVDSDARAERQNTCMWKAGEKEDRVKKKA
jgi:hypothetical protein